MGARYQADVVVAGGGLAGLVTALELLDSGHSVVLLDRGSADGLGGLARIAFGGIFIVGSPEQRRGGIHDSVELATRDWLAYGELDEADTWPRQWVEAYVNASRPEVYDWLRARQVKFFPVVHWVERGLHGPGNSVPRFHMVWGTGHRLIQALLDHLQVHPNRDRLLMLFGHRVTGLIEEAGQIRGCSGVIEKTGEGGINIESGAFEASADCVVIASGGITGNLDLVRRMWDRTWCEPPELLLNGSHPAADGALHEVAREHGAAVTHLDKMWLYAGGVHHWKPEHPLHGLSLVPPKSALWVDRHGRRLGPPALVSGFDTRYLVETICRQGGGRSWQVLNQRIARKELAVSGSEFNHAMRERRLPNFLLTLLLGSRELVQEFIDKCEDFVTADTVPELAAKMNELAGNRDIDAEVLGDQIRSYDDMITRGRKFHDDDQLRRIAQARSYRGDRVRTSKFARIDDSTARPLIAIREHVLTRKSLGGLQTDLSSRVLDAAGQPLDGLFAVGEAAGFGGGGIHGIRSLEGTFLGGCIYTARQAAHAIAAGRGR
jgi:predicted oxidoreductase